MNTKTQSKDLKPGTIMEFRDGSRVVLRERKLADPFDELPFHPGWWIEGGGGLADFVIDREDSEWRVVRDSVDEIRRTKP